MKTKFFISIILFALGIVSNAQTSKESANERLLNTLADKLDSYNIYAHTTALSANDTIFLQDGTYIITPFQSSLCYFVDEMPAAGWTHSCKYYFYDMNSDRHLVIGKDICPMHYDEYEIISAANMNASPQWTGIPDANYNRDNSAAPDEHQWAILISSYGGDDMKRFWGDLSCVYNVLTNRYGFIENQQNTDETSKYCNHISVVAPEHVFNFNTDLNNSGGYSNQDFFSSLPYGIIDGISMCYNQTRDNYYTKNTIKLLLDNFAGKDTTLYSQGYRALDSLDKLFVYVTGHGKYDENNNNSYINVKDEYDNVIKLYDYELSEWLKDIDCSQITVVMQPCHSGGFIDDIMDLTNVKCKNRAVYTSSDTEGVSFAESYINSIQSPGFNGRDVYDNFWCDEFTYYWSAALLGYYPIIRWNQTPPIGPWDVFENNKIGQFPWELFFDETESLNHEAYDVSPDINNDGIVSLDEAFVFTKRIDSWDETGYYNPYQHYIDGIVEYPQSAHESSFTKEFITLDGYKGMSSNNSDISTCCDSRYSLSGWITIEAGTTLTINDNTSLYGNGHAILNRGSIQTADDNYNSILYNLAINNYGDNFIVKNCSFIDGDKIFIANGIVDIRNSKFNNTQLEVGRISPILNQKVTSTNIIGNEFLNSIDAITINASSNVNIKDNFITAKSKGIYLNNCTGNNTRFALNKYNSDIYITDNVIRNCTTGLLSYSSNAYISNNKIQDNDIGLSLYNLSNTIIMGKSNAFSPNLTQEIKNNTNYQIETSENSFPKTIKYNCISNNLNNNYLIHSSGNNKDTLCLDVTYNCWEPLDDNSVLSKLYANNGYFYTYLPTWCPSIPFDTAQIDPNTPSRMLANSDSLIGYEKYNDAYDILVDIVHFHPNTNEAAVAMKSMLYLRYYTDNDYNALKSYYRTDPIVIANSSLADLGDNLANKCDEILHNYDDAIEWYENIINDENASYEDKVFATIDLGNLYLRIQEEGNKSIGTLSNLVPKSAEQHAKTTTYLLSTLPGNITNGNQNDLTKDIVHNCVATITNDNNVKIYLKEGNADITFYNTLGVAVKQSALIEGENIINAEDLKAGVYIWKTLSNENIINTGKIVKK